MNDHFVVVRMGRGLEFESRGDSQSSGENVEDVIRAYLAKDAATNVPPPPDGDDNVSN